MIGFGLILTLAQADAQPDPGETLGNVESLETIRTEFGYGKYEQVLVHAEVRIDQGVASEPELTSLHEYAALSAFNQNRVEVAEKHFKALLRLDPDFRLDPFVVPPAAIKFLDRIRKQVASDLPHWRAERRLRIENSRKRLPELDADKALLITDARSKIGYNPLINFIPFGFAQYYQGRRTMGLVLSLSEGALAVTSLGALASYYAMLSPRLSEVTGSRGTFVARELGVIPRLQNLSQTFRVINLVSAIAFYAVYGFGVWDAFHHQTKPRFLEVTQFVASPENVGINIKASF